MEVTYSWIIFICFIFGSGVLCERKLERRQAVSSCSKNSGDMFYCSNELCIEWSSVCDNYEDCSDGSDETKDLCGRYEHGTNMTMDCGRVRIKNQVISEEGKKETLVETAPWYVRIYKLRNSEYQMMCGGSIIAPNLVISAARCFWEKGMIYTNMSFNRQIYLYKICVGIYSLFLPTINNDFTQTLNVEMIYPSEGYDGTYSEDIAVIVLRNQVSFKNGLATPVCIDWNNKYPVANRDEGKVIALNATSLNQAKYPLIENNSTYINPITCEKAFPTILSKHVDLHKFCASTNLEKYLTGFYVEGTGISFLHSNSYFLTGLSTPEVFWGNVSVIQRYTDINRRIIVDWIRGIFNKHVTVKSCVLPSVEGVVYTHGVSNEILSHGALIDYNTYVIENCENGYHKAYPRFRLCQEKGKWVSNSEKLCFKMCPPLESDSLNIKCSYNGGFADCSNFSIPGTKATPTCKPAYYSQERTPLELVCQSNGQWNNQLNTCNLYCGRVYVKSNELIAHGGTALVGTAIWNVALYRISENKSNYELICGGSIISSNLVVSAAHCFGNQRISSNKILISDFKYKVAVGKYNRNFTIIDNEFTEKIDVEMVYTKGDYYGYEGNYGEDIAIIVLLKKISFSNGVAPVCIDWDSNNNVANGDKGKIFGWGKTEDGILSPNLLEASLPYIDRISCRNMYKNGFERFLTIDKFCAGSALGQGVSFGDSGAGLCYLYSDSYYLTGVVSIKDPVTNNSIATFTDIKYHIQWIREIYHRHK